MDADENANGMTPSGQIGAADGHVELKHNMLAAKSAANDTKKKALQLKEIINRGKVMIALATLDVGTRNRFELDIENKLEKIL